MRWRNVVIFGINTAAMDVWEKSKYYLRILRDFISKYRGLNWHYGMCVIKIVIAIKKTSVNDILLIV